MSAYQDDIKAVAALKEQYGSSWAAINPESVARMRAQNRFKTGLEIAQYTADIMRKDMAEYDADSSVYTQRSEEHTSELQSLMRISYAVFCLKKKKKTT